MLSLVASLAGVVSAVMAVIYTFMRSRHERRRYETLLAECRAANDRVAQRLAELEVHIQSASTRLHRLEVAAKNGVCAPTPIEDRLARLEALGDESQLHDAHALANAAHSMCSPDERTWSDPFENEDQLLSIARLADQGHSAAEIARRLGKPVGEVELRLSLR